MTACVPYRPSDERRTLPSHDVCQVQGQLQVPGSAGRSRAVPEVFGEETPQTTLLHSRSRTRTRSFCLSFVQVFLPLEMFFEQSTPSSSVCIPGSVRLICHMLSCVSPHFRPPCSNHRRCTATMLSLLQGILGLHSGSLPRKTRFCWPLSCP